MREFKLKSQFEPRSQFLSILDVLRGVAIGAVFLFHSLGAAYGKFHLPWRGLLPNFSNAGSLVFLSPLSFGFTGVAIFFVISGFCIHLSYISDVHWTWSNFVKKRLLRIYPAYFLALFFLLVSPFLMYPITPQLMGWQLTTHILAIHNIKKETCFGINPSFWSLAVEIQLYLLYPILLQLRNKMGWKKTLIILGILELFIRSTTLLTDLFLHREPYHVLILSPFAYWFSWSLGAYVCDCWKKNQKSFLDKFNVFWIGCFSFISIFFRPLIPFTFVLVALTTATFLYQYLVSSHKEIRNQILKKIQNHLALLGLVSYSFYLFHQPLLASTHKIVNRFLPNIFIPSFFMFLLMMLWYPIILVASYLIFTLIEKPFIQFARKPNLGSPLIKRH